MSLDDATFSLDKIQNKETLCYTRDGAIHPLTEALIACCYLNGISCILDTNWKDVYMRICMHESLAGPFLADSNGVPQFITPQEVVAHTGLTTSARFVPLAQWWAGVRKDLPEYTLEEA